MKKYIDVPLSWGQLRQLAIEHEKLDIVTKMDSLNSDDYGLFISDGCSMWPDVWRIKAIDLNIDLSAECFWHDVDYFLGGTPEERLKSDNKLLNAVEEKSFIMSHLMFAGVRAGGWVHGTGFHWGYGRLVS